MIDHRPVNCRFRLQDEGKPYPRSSCEACGRSVLTGLGKRCHHEWEDADICLVGGQKFIIKKEEEVSAISEKYETIKRNRDDLLASCIEFLPILERHLETINRVAESSIAYQTAKSRVDRMRLAIENAKKEKQ